MHDGLSVERIETSQRLRDVEPEWSDLWRRVPAATPFVSPAWLIAWYDAFAPGPLCCVALRSGPRLVGFAPFYFENSGRRRRFLPLGISISDYFDVLVDPAYEDAVSLRLIGALLGPDRDDALCCEELIRDSAAQRMWADSDWRSTLARQSACPVLLIDRLVQAQVPAAKLRKLRMARHRIARRKGVVASPESSSAFLAELFRLHAARWNGCGQPGVLADARVRRFHETVLPALLDAGLLRLYWLCIDSRIAGAYYGFQWRGRAYAYLGGFDPEFAYESPGTVLIGHAIEQAAREGATEFHFLRGGESYKYQWGAQDRWNVRLELRRPP